MKEIESLRAMNQRLEKTIHAAIEESKRLASVLRHSAGTTKINSRSKASCFLTIGVR